MTLQEIIHWLDEVMVRPAEPRRVAHELNRCSTNAASAEVIGQFQQAIALRFVTPRRRQLDQVQLEAIRVACDFAAAGGPNALAFPQLNRVTVALQLVARVIDPSLVHQGQYQLCGPAAVAISLVREAPLRYVTACTELADQGRTQLHNRQVAPSDAVRNALPNGTAADWIMCASLRADDRAITDGMYGTCGPEDVFRFLCDCGFRKVILAVDFPTSMVRCQPPQLIPDSGSTADRVRLLRDMVNLAGNGWRTVMFVYGAMTEALGAASTGEIQRLLVPDATGQMIRDRAQATAEVALRTPNPGLVGLFWKMVTGNLGAHTMHVTFVSHARIEGDDIKISCVNFGQHQRWLTFPLVDFANKFVGYAAATDIG